MSGLRSRLKHIWGLPKPLPPNTVQTVPPPDSKGDKRTISKPISKTKDFGFLEIASGTDPIVDIVAIHGLQGHREKTWTTDNGILWLQHLLPSDLPNARILSYGYDADTHSPECVSTHTMRRHADQLAKALSMSRKDVPRALVICHNQRLDSKADLRDVLVSTHAIFFFGTPHSGVENTTLLEAINRLAAVYMETTDLILKELRAHSFELEDIQSLYVAASQNINVIFLCEEYPDTKIGEYVEPVSISVFGENDPTERQSVPYHSATIAGDYNATTIVLHANHRDLVNFTRVIVVDASNQEQLEKDLELSIRSLGPEYSNMTWKDAMIYLEGKEKGWLLFLDNADSRNLNLLPYIPKSSHGAILITTRNSECIGYAPGGAVPVGGLEENEAVELLHTIANVAPASDENSIEIVKELGMLALAIIQAGAYIRKTRRLDTYLDTLRRHRNELLRNKLGVGTEYTSSTYAVFDLSFHRLPDRTKSFMKLCALLHHSPIPTRLFEQSTLSKFSLYRVRDSCPPPKSDMDLISRLQDIFGVIWNQPKFQALVDSAASASFIDISSDGLFYTVHPLLQMYIRDRLDETGSQQYARMAALLLLGTIRPIEDSNAELWQLLPHVNNISRSVQSNSVSSALAFHEFYHSLGDWKACRELLEAALSQLHQTKGRRHEDSVWVAEKLAISLHNCGQFDAGEKLQREVLILRLDTLGRRHLDTMVAMNNLGNTLSHRSQWDEAETMLREVLALRLKVLGERHLDTISVTNDLANTLSHRRQWDKAETMMRQVLALRTDILGRRHRDTISVMNSLATTLSHCGQGEEAEKMLRGVLALRLEILGQRHPDTVKAMNNLANTLSHHGRLDEAERMQRDVLVLRQDVLGRQHPDTIKAMNNLASMCFKSGRFDETEKIQREILALRLETLGRKHSDTIVAMSNLSKTLGRIGRLDKVEELQEQILALRIEMLGRSDLSTISAMEQLANTVHERGQLSRAEKIQREVFALRLKDPGRRHPDTIEAMRTLANTLRDLGKLEEAEKMDREIVALMLEVFGRNAETLKASYNLSMKLYKSGKHDEAAKLVEETMGIRHEVLGGDNPNTRLPKQVLRL
ncbi:related to kinesin light chain [Serendipita indica DSM 11827]|uniref:Related to kinesin light chain n=1 Tax=Serendipita indica (strain DSM 11827) TaxID=1109443 RepID=G4TQ64_SERID|nr:related to kinesin light chain [Serendipita indica DSM 11827]